MSRAIPLLAVLCTGVALGALIVAVVAANRADSGSIEEVAPLDPAVAVPEIAEIRESRGSVLAGTALGNSEDAADFSTALVRQTGIEPIAREPESLVELLNRSASEYDERARGLKSYHEYSVALQLRRLADDARRVAHSLSNAQTELGSAATIEQR